MFPDWKDNLFVTAMVPGDLRRLTMVDNKVVDQEILFGIKEKQVALPKK